MDGRVQQALLQPVGLEALVVGVAIWVTAQVPVRSAAEIGP
ncbi:MAG TPA: hypothetical protein VNF03_17990 [Patescibacteria group bacterium]|nr:hypothetical protein [Patescibacteria group bacterium]